MKGKTLCQVFADDREKELSVIRDPLVREVRKAYRATDKYRLDRLLAEESRWKRKVTIASNKLAAVRNQINKLAAELAAPKNENQKESAD